MVIPLKPKSWNALARKHYRTVMAFSREWHDAVLFQVLKGSVFPVSAYPVELHIEAHWKLRRRHDIDSLCVKFAVDALVEYGILADDDLAHISKVVFTGKTGQPEDELVIEIKSAP